MNERMRRERSLGFLVLAGVIWIVLHVFTGFRNLIYGMDCYFHGFDILAFLLGAAYAVSLLVFDAMLFYAKSRTASRVMMRFWAVCGAVAACVLAASRAGVELYLWVVLPVLLTPYFPLWSLADRVPLPFEWNMTAGGMAAVFLLCLGHMGYGFLLLQREKRGERRGSVDP